MDELPMMPGLMDGAADAEDLPDEVPEEGEAGDIVAILNSMAPDEIAALQADADESLMAGELDALMSGADVADAEPGEVVVADGEDELGGETEGESLTEGAAEPDAGQVATESGALLAEIGSIQSQLADLAEAHEDSEADLDVDSAIAEVEDALKKAEEAHADVEAAADEGDHEAAVEAKKVVEEALEEAKAAHEAIKEEAKGAAAELTEEPDPIVLWADANA